MKLDMPLEEAMSTQRAIRRLTNDPVDDELVLHLIELALKAPSGSNQQNWEFLVVKDRAVKERLGRLNHGAWNLYGGLGRRMYAQNPAMLRIMNAVQWQADHFVDIPVIVVACLRGFRPAWPPVASTSWAVTTSGPGTTSMRSSVSHNSRCSMAGCRWPAGRK